jgi:maltose O-acetyltransferase
MIWGLLRRLRNFWRQLAESLNLKYSQLQCRLANGQFDYGNGVFFHVPVRIDGAGRVKVGANNHFGYRYAPKLGNGEILLQARNPEARISIGQRNWFSNNGAIISCSEITIGNDCLFGDGVTIFDSDFHDLNPQNRRTGGGECHQ